MKNFIIFLLVIILAIVLIFLLKNNNEVIPKQDSTETTKHFEGDLFSFDYPSDFDLNNDAENYTTLRGKDNNILIFSISNIDKISDTISIEEWWGNSGPQNERGAPLPDENQSLVKNIGSNEILYTVYEIEGYPALSGIYSPVSVFLINNRKVYEIRTQKLPSSSEALASLSAQEVETVKEHEKVFWQVLETLRFK